LVLVLALSLAACGGNSGNTGGNSSTTPSGTTTTPPADTTPSIVNDADEAWVNADNGMAYIFADGDTYKSYTKENGSWISNGDGTYKAAGTTLTLDKSDYPYSVNATTLTFTISGTDYNYNRTTPFSVTIPAVVEEHDEKLVLSGGQSWVQKTDTISDAFTFSADGSYTFHDDLENHVWKVQSSGKWHTSGGTLYLLEYAGTTYEGESYYTYKIEGDKLTLTKLGDDIVFIADTIK
jgi:hypothetical protein